MGLVAKKCCRFVASTSSVSSNAAVDCCGAIDGCAHFRVVVVVGIVVGTIEFVSDFRTKV
jgi:hypothetical protein